MNVLKPINKQNLSWAFYDWGNSAFATTVMAIFFPYFLKTFWSTGDSVNESTLQLGFANSLAGALLVIMSPFLGTIADKLGAKKKMLFSFVLLGVFFTGALAFIPKGNSSLAIICFILATIGFNSSNIFYDSLIVYVTEKKYIDFISGFGFGIGYLGGGILLVINVLMSVKPDLFYFIQDANHAVQLSFLTVAIWWLLFTFPLMKWVKEKNTNVNNNKFNAKLFKDTIQELKKTFFEIIKHKNLLFFLLGYLFYIDGINTTIKMAVDYGLSLGFEFENLIYALLLVQFIGFPAAIVFGYLGQIIGSIKGIFIGLVAYIIVIFWGFFMTEVSEFYIMASMIGLVQGGVQALSRSLYGKLIPADRSAEFFGFFNMVGKFSAILGPLMVGFVSYASGSARLSILSLITFFILGGALLSRVRLA
ncbi:MAG: MFS transporter [Bdellovibrionaceae bacterium]|jgi:MFS transporter, UMF1 family|nr:MFS transporter [Pseudobdellovibrionaceae bacterium]